MTGVLLNAGAQLLLKAGTNALGVITLTRDNWSDTLWRMGTQGHFVAGVACYMVSLVRVDHRPVARAGVGRVSDAVAGLRDQRRRRALPVRRSGDGRPAGSASASSSLGVWLVARS